MKLAEALIKKKDLNKAINRIQEETLSVLSTNNVESAKYPQSYFDEKQKEMSEMYDELYSLNYKIDVTNAQHNIEKMAGLKMSASQITFYKQMRKKLLEEDSWRSAETFVKNMEIGVVNGWLKTAEDLNRKYDQALQAANWQIDLVE